MCKEKMYINVRKGKTEIVKVQEYFIFLIYPLWQYLKTYFIYVHVTMIIAICWSRPLQSMQLQQTTGQLIT